MAINKLSDGIASVNDETSAYLAQMSAAKAEDESGQIVRITVDQKLKDGVEIGGISIGAQRTPFFAPESEKTSVTVQQTQKSGAVVGSVTVDGDTTVLYAPSQSTVSVSPTLTTGAEIGSITVNGTKSTLYAPQGGGGEGGSVVTVDQKLTSGTEIGGITVDGTRTALYAPKSGGGGDSSPETELLEEVRLTETASIINVGVDDGTYLYDKFYIEGAFYKNNSTAAAATNVNVYLTAGTNEKQIGGGMSLNTSADTYFAAQGEKMYDGKWTILMKTGNSSTAVPTGGGTAVGNFSWQTKTNADSNAPSRPTSISLRCSSGAFGTGTTLRFYGNTASA